MPKKPAPNGKVPLYVCIPQEMKLKLEVNAVNRGLTVTGILTMLIEDYLVEYDLRKRTKLL